MSVMLTTSTTWRTAESQSLAHSISSWSRAAVSHPSSSKLRYAPVQTIWKFGPGRFNPHLCPRLSHLVSCHDLVVVGRPHLSVVGHTFCGHFFLLYSWSARSVSALLTDMVYCMMGKVIRLSCHSWSAIQSMLHQSPWLLQTWQVPSSKLALSPT